MITWKITKLECKPLLDGLPEVVVSANWLCVLEKNGQRTDLTGLVQFPPPKPMNFTLYSNLSEDQVLEWMWSSCLNKEYIESMLENQIEQIVNPNPETPPLPWDHSALTNT